MQLQKYIQIFEYTFFFGLCGLSVYFMYGVLDKFFSGKTSISMSEESIKELPSIMLCFDNSKTVYHELGPDFKIKYEIIYPNYTKKKVYLRIIRMF